MIVDKIENWRLYQYGEAWWQAFKFLTALTPDADETDYPIQGDDIFARVMSYKTGLPEDSFFGAHRRFADIHVILMGSERIELFSACDMTVAKPYDKSTDIEIYVNPEQSRAKIDLHPGTFLALFPNDAHMTALNTDRFPKNIKKAQVKISIGLLL